MAVGNRANGVPRQTAAPEKRGRLEAQTQRLAGSGLLAAGGLLSALAASSCCIVPLVLFTLGVGGAWIGNLTALAPYQPLFVALTLGFLGSGFYLVYRRPKAECADATACARPGSRRMVKTALWSATVLVATAMAFPYIAPLLLGNY
jgi:mercuric ion transport protein